MNDAGSALGSDVPMRARRLRTKRKVVDAGGRGRRRAVGVVSSVGGTHVACDCQGVLSRGLLLPDLDRDGRGHRARRRVRHRARLGPSVPLSRSVTGMCAEVLFARDRRGLSVSVLWTPAALRRSTMRHRVRCRSATEGSSSRCALLDVDVR